ncbi:hypothetical protein [Catelliglobosispora koreensis]|uniref:hypothetical protein n=1 Tax=Catelliglobosispora koreensis TaxID=129052 RepID=UPI0003A1364B|nr:hypothetical protein [Catelliglobosispora koreensis]
MSRGRDRDDDDLPREETGWLDDLRSAKKSEDRVPGRAKGGGTDRWSKLSALSGDDDPPPPPRDPGPREPRREEPRREDSRRDEPRRDEPRRGEDGPGRRRAAEIANSMIGRRARDDEDTSRSPSSLIGRRAAERDRDRDRTFTEPPAREPEGRRRRGEDTERPTRGRRAAPEEEPTFPREDTTFPRRSGDDRRDTGSGRRARPEPFEPPRTDPVPGAPLRRRESEPPAGGLPPAASTSPFSPEGRRARSMFAGGGTETPVSPAPPSRVPSAPFSPAAPPPVSPAVPPVRRAPVEPILAPPVTPPPIAPRPPMPDDGTGPRARGGLAAGVEAIRGARSEVRRQLREQQRLRMWTLITLVVAIVGALPFYFVLQAATRDPVITSLDALPVPSWAAVSKEDIITGSRWCLMDCRLRERKTKSAQSIEETEKAYKDALVAAGWTQMTDVPTCEVVDGYAHTCWRRDEFTLDLTVSPPDCEDKLHGRPTIAPTASSDPSAEPSAGVPASASAGPPPSDCSGSVVSIKVFNAIVDERLRDQPAPTVDPNLNDEDLQTTSPTPTP